LQFVSFLIILIKRDRKEIKNAKHGLAKSRAKSKVKKYSQKNKGEIK
jgi:hypothetical protein